MESRQLSQVKVVDRRRHPRKDCRWRAVIYRNSQILDCLVVNYSKGGCRLSFAKAAPLQVGDYIALELAERGLSFDGMVAWKSGQDVGVEFITEKSRHVVTILP